MKLFLRMLSLILVFALMSSMISAPASAAENDHNGYVLLEVTETTAVLRTKAEYESDVCATAYKGDILYCSDSTTNRHGNVWYKCLFIEDGTQQAGWIYSERVTKHQHELTQVSEDDAMKLSYCRCGYYELSPSATQKMDYSIALPQNQPLISPEDIALAVGLLKAAGAEILGAVPYVIPFAIGGLAYMISVQCNTTTAEVIDVKKLSKEYRPGDYEDGKYYYSAIYKKPSKTDGVYSTVLIYPGKAMELDDAVSFMLKIVTVNQWIMGTCDDIQVRIDSVYTPDGNDAESLCKELAQYGFSYGRSKYADGQSEENQKNLVPNWLYYEHYHIHTSTFNKAAHSNGDYTKCPGHVFFGIPFSYNGYPLGRF